MSTTGERFERAVEIMERLRAPGGCPWDREQTFDSIKPYTLEETYEVLEAIDNRDWDELPGELGDVLLQVLFYAQMAKDQGTFSIDEVLDRLSDKLVNRHPHVFGDVKAETSDRTFDSIKPYTLEETYEVLEAIDNRDWDELPGELGDVLLQVLFYAQMAKDQGTFSIDEVLDRLSDKLVNRHPHVFGDVKAET